MKINCTLFYLLILFSGKVAAQTKISLKNPSFEEQEPAYNQCPSFWKDLGTETATPPDVQPGFYGVKEAPQHGRTYLGLVVREDNTWEGVGQVLGGTLQKDSAYTFSLYLNRSNTYQSATWQNTGPVKFNNPTILKIWGYNTETQQEELLAESQPVSHSKWVRYEFLLKPTQGDYNELDLMAYYAPGYEQTNGNLLIDDCSAIVKK